MWKSSTHDSKMAVLSAWIWLHCFQMYKVVSLWGLRESCVWLTPTALPRGKNTQINPTKILLHVFMWVELMEAFDDLMISPFQAKMSDHEVRTSSQWKRFLFYWWGSFQELSDHRDATKLSTFSAHNGILSAASLNVSNMFLKTPHRKDLDVRCHQSWLSGLIPIRFAALHQPVQSPQQI